MSIRIRRLIGNRAFYAMVLAVVVPIIVQNAITNFVNLLDNMMVGRIGTDQMSGVAIANQLVFVFNLGVFGVASGAGIFAAQYHGSGNTEGVRASLRYKLYGSVFFSAAAILVFLALGPKLVMLYLSDTSDPARVQATLSFALEYLHIMLLGLLPFAIAQSYASTLRETGETAVPMYASIAAVVVNLVFNYLLIFGKLGFPALGVTGAAIATILSRYLEMVIILVYTHTHTRKHAFAAGLYRTLRIPRSIVRDITVKGTPLLINELMWAMGMAVITQIYCMRGLDVVAATNISSSVYNLFSVTFLSMGTATSIIIGQELGANNIEVAKDYSGKLMAFAGMISVGVGIVLFAFSRSIPMLYNTTAAVHDLATRLIRASIYLMPVTSMTNCAYFTLRSGGKTGITFLFDSGFVWLVNIPVAFLLAKLTAMPIVPLYFLIQLLETLKLSFGLYLIRKGVWINNIVSGDLQTSK